MKSTNFKIIAIAFSLCMAAFTGNTMAQEIIYEGECGDNLTWVLTDDGTLTISGTGEMYNYLSSTQPWYHLQNSINDVIIENGVTSIGQFAFSNSSLKSVSIPTSVSIIGDYAFWDCSGLSGELTIPESVTFIGRYAFFNCSGLTGELIIPDSILEIEFGVFAGCSNFSSVSFPDSLTSIGSNAFRDCKGLIGELNLPEFLTYIGSESFHNCIGLSGKLTIPNSVTHIGQEAFYNCNGFIGELIIPESVSSIGIRTFALCSGFTSINYNSNGYPFYLFSDSISVNNKTNKSKSPSDSMFAGCFNVEKITIGEKVKMINDLAFLGCNNATVLNYNAQNVLKAGWDDIPVFPSSITEVNLGSEVETIPDFAFQYLINLESITIPESVTEIGDGAFASCGLTSITIPENITYVGSFAFDYCTKLAEVTFNAIKCFSFGNSAGLWYYYDHTPRLEKVNIGSKVTNFSVTWFNFGDLQLFTEINVHPENKTYSSENGVLFDKLKTHLIQYPAGKTEDHYNVPESVKTIGDYAFYNSYNLSSVNTENNLYLIGESAFRICNQLTSIILPSSLMYIHNWAFFNSSNLNTIICKASTPPILYEDVFVGVPKSAQVFVPCGSTSKYYSSSWRRFDDFIEEGDIEIPVNINIKAEDESFIISWEGETKLFAVYRNNELLTTCYAASYADYDLINGTTYCYQIKALFGDCESEFSEEVCNLYSSLSNISQEPLSAYVQNNILYISGLKLCESWSVYNVTGVLIAESGVSTNSTTKKQKAEGESITSHLSPLTSVTLPCRGVYIVQAGNKGVKVVY